MVTERLYYGDDLLRSFAAHVLQRGSYRDRPAVVLDRTAFYPEGGGQPADRGTLDEYLVRDVQVDGSGTIWHLLDEPFPPNRTEVTGSIDWPRRFDHLQQHLGQHLLSAAFEEICQLPTIAFHLGQTHVTIDLPSPPLEDQVLRRVEARVNQVIWETRPVEARFVDPEELASLHLRKTPTVIGPVRVVSVVGFDHSPCGGTHPTNTGGVGGLAILGQERQGSEIRIVFVCGGRLIRTATTTTTQLDSVARDLTVGVADLPETIARLRTDLGRSHKQIEALEQELATAEAQRLLREADPAKLVRATVSPRPLQWGRLLANAIVAHGSVALITTTEPSPQLLVASPPALLDAGATLKAILQQYGGRGGGSPALAQGGLPSPKALEQAAIDLEKTIQSRLTP